MMTKNKLQIREYTKSKPAELFKQKECHFMADIEKAFSHRIAIFFF